MRNKQQSSLEFLQRLFKAFSCGQIEVICRLVQKQYVAVLAFKHAQRKLCPLSAGKRFDRLLHILLEQSATGKRRAHLRLRQPEMSVPKLCHYGAFGIEVAALLVVISKPYKPPDLD